MFPSSGFLVRFRDDSFFFFVLVRLQRLTWIGSPIFVAFETDTFAFKLE